MTPSKSEVIVGIDNGISGALAAIARKDGALLGYTRMPVITHAGKKEPDVSTIYAWLLKYSDWPEVGLEQPLNHARSSQAMRSMSIGYGMIRGMLEFSPDITAHYVGVQQWQKAMLGKVPRGRTKEFALATARHMQPKEDWLASARSTTPHDGVIDAYLIARYVRDFLAR